MPQSAKKGRHSRQSSQEKHADPTASTVENQQELEEIERQEEEADAKLSSLSSADVERLRSLSADDIKAMDGPIEYAINSFFENRIEDCESTLRAHMSDDPLAVTGAGLIAFIRCALSMEQEQADIALGLLNKASALATQVMTNNRGAVSQTFSRMWHFRKSAKDKWLSPSEFRAKTTYTESQAIRCFVLVLQQSVTSVLKAGVALNRANGNYKSLYAEMEQRYKEKCGSKAIQLDAKGSPATSPNTLKEKDASLEMSAALETLGLDRNSVHCVEFGLGAINLVVSLLPTNVRSMLRFIGVEGDRQYGLRLVRQCFMSNSLLSSFASLLLLALYSFLPATSAFLRESYVPVAQEVRQELLRQENMQESLLHLWLDGRIERLTRNVEESTVKLNRCLNVASNPQLLTTMPQLRDFVVYDQWFNYAILHQWKRASRCLEVLSKTSKWANSYYQYTQATCLEMLEQEWADGIHNPEGEEDFALADLQRIVGGAKDSEAPRIDFCDISSQDAIHATISQLYWEAAQRKPVTLGGKPNHHDQFAVKRMEEMLTMYGVNASTYVAKKKLGEELEPMPKGLHLRNTVPLPAYEMLLLVNVAPLLPAPQRERMLQHVESDLFKEPAVSDTPLATYVAGMVKALPRTDPKRKKSRSLPRSRNSRQDSEQGSFAHTTPRSRHSRLRDKYAMLPANYRVLCLCVMKAMLLATSESKKDRTHALKVIKVVRETPAYKDRQWTLSYAQPFALYEQAYVAYLDESRDAAETLLNSLHKQYDNAHYFMHAKIDFKAHLASYELREQRQNAAAAAKSK